MAPRFRLALAVGSVLIISAPVLAQEWTRFRGPNGTGISLATTVPVECTDANRNWKVELPGIGHSSPVIWGDRIFVTTAEEQTGKRHVICLAAKDGKEVWRRTYDFSAYPHHKFNNAAAATLAVDAERVYVPWCSPAGLVLHALDHQGKDVWTADLGKWEGQHGGACSPIVVDDIVVMRNDCDGAPGGPPSFLFGLDVKTGKPRWKLPRVGKTASYSTPILYEPKGSPAELIVTSDGHGFTSVNPKTGEVNWEVNGIFQQRCVSGPVIVNGLIFQTTGNGGGSRQGIAVRPGTRMPKTDPKIELQLPPRGLPYVPTPLVVGDLMFLWSDAGIVTCAKAATGEPIWSERVGGNFFGSPVCVNGKIYAMSASGELVVVEAAPQFKLLGRSQLGEATHSTPAVSGGVMYLRTESHLISVGGKK